MGTRVGYSQIFNRLCHMVALSKDGKTRAAIDNLVVTVLAIDGKLIASTTAEITEAINVYFGLSLSEGLVQPSVDSNLSAGRIVRDAGSGLLLLAPQPRVEIEARVAEATALEAFVRDEWLAELAQGSRAVPSAWGDQLWACLRAYMARAFQRHGVQTVLLLNPATPVTDDDKENLSTHLGTAICQTCKGVPPDIAAEAVRRFFATVTSSRARYVTQLLDGTFTFFALSADEATAAYLRGAVSTLNLFLDTNFILGILDIRPNPLNDVSQELVKFIATNDLPYRLCYHDETLLELQRSIDTIGNRLRGHKWSQALSRAAVKTGQLIGLEARYHEKNAEAPLDPEIYLSQYRHIAELLSEHGIEKYAVGAVEASQANVRQLVDEYRKYLRRHRPLSPKPVAAMNHDMAVWAAVKGLRHEGNSVLDCGAFFLTVDYYLYSFDWQRLRDRDALGVTVLPNQFLQLLRPFVPCTDDFDRRFVETFAIPEFRVSGGDYTETRSKVLSYLTTYSDVSERTAVRILANELTIQQLGGVDEHSEHFKALVDSAIAADNERLAELNEALANDVRLALERVTEVEKLFTQRDQQLRQRDGEKRSAETMAKDSQRTADEAWELIGQIKAELTSERDARQRAEKERDRNASLLRLGVGLLVAMLGTFVVVVLPGLIQWPWLDEHPNRLGLRGGAMMVVVGGATAIVGWKRWQGWVLVLVTGGFSVLFQVLGK